MAIDYNTCITMETDQNKPQYVSKVIAKKSLKIPKG